MTPIDITYGIFSSVAVAALILSVFALVLIFKAPKVPEESTVQKLIHERIVSGDLALKLPDDPKNPGTPIERTGTHSLLAQAVDEADAKNLFRDGKTADLKSIANRTLGIDWAPPTGHGRHRAVFANAKTISERNDRIREAMNAGVVHIPSKTLADEINEARDRQIRNAPEGLAGIATLVNSRLPVDPEAPTLKLPENGNRLGDYAEPKPIDPRSLFTTPERRARAEAAQARLEAENEEIMKRQAKGRIIRERDSGIVVHQWLHAPANGIGTVKDPVDRELALPKPQTPPAAESGVSPGPDGSR